MKARASAAVMFLTIYCLVAGAAAQAQDQRAGAKPLGLDPHHLCVLVSEKIEATSDPDPEVQYLYQRAIRDAAGVAFADDPGAVRTKIQSWWAEHQAELYCDVLNSSVGHGHILRLGVDRASDEFINDIVRRWQVDLNHLDIRHGGTVIDFLDQEVIKAAGTPREAFLIRYRSLFERHGARRGEDLAVER